MEESKLDLNAVNETKISDPVEGLVSRWSKTGGIEIEVHQGLIAVVASFLVLLNKGDK